MMTTHVDAASTRASLLPAGWLIAVVVAVLAYVAKPDDELGFAIVVGGLAAAMAYWTHRTSGLTSVIVSLVLGLLWTLLFGGYAVANVASADDVQLLVRVADLLAVAGGIMILWGAVDRLRRTRRLHAR